MSSTFDLVCDMEAPLTRARDMAFAIQLMTDTLESDIRDAITAVAEEVGAQIKRVEKLQGEVFHELHPNKGRYTPAVTS